jgi:NADH-quinone oxidoreductase subunit G
VGCNVELHARDQALQRMVPRENMAVNNEWLCDRGRFDTLPANVERVRQPLVEGLVAPWPEALQMAAGALRGPSVEIVASPSLTNEALNALRTIAAGLKAPLGVWPARTGRVRGSIEDLAASNTIVLLDFDVWTELPVLALRIREALKRGARLYFVGSTGNGLRRDTTASYRTADDLLAALNGSPPGPVSVLGRGAEDVAQRLEAGGMVGEPPTAANGYAMADLPRASFQADVLLLAGNEAWPVHARGEGHHRIVALRWSPDADLVGHGLIVLPVTHPYEQTGSITNLEGRVQQLRAGGRVAGEARPDWAVLADLARTLGLEAVRGDRQAALA